MSGNPLILYQGWSGGQGSIVVRAPSLEHHNTTRDSIWSSLSGLLATVFETARHVLPSSLSCKSSFVNLTSCMWPNLILLQNFVIMLEIASHE